MKLSIVLLLALMAAAFSNPARVRVAHRNYREDGRRYIVEYMYSMDLTETPAFVTATDRENNPHYQAEISVYELNGGARTLIAPSFDGYYTELGCVEDKPSTLVHRALSLAERRN